ncbi:MULTISPECIES: carbon starvation protein A [Enterocloster]|uniref:Carbon starvation protein CstA n=1 Tax=Enterocloster lavalensis TaxID=460384 RepID=A0A1I0EIS0_9FIRM|nr:MULTISPECIES: carbon starvation CstA family protein [Enterocloster]MCB6344347.1 carbon starvation protein A [Enterocloster lavalensis]MDR3758650.1 carbon starvation CstA family protein [Enterocloster sp.]PST34714.1 carbon starvation protein A [Enterocloster lavalensis]SET45307.1 Carbon starvation protein CstA [Enterocloster lavalensis]
MVSFLGGLVLLIAGYFLYGSFVERVFHPDSRQTPAYAMEDNVDFVPMSTSRAFLVQLLNIAGLGPIFGALSGALWGPVVYIWIVLGTIFAGGVHDYLSGMLSERNNGASISEIVGKYLGPVMAVVMRIFSVILLVMVGVVFMVGPAGLIALLTPEALNVQFWTIVILIYYFLATLLPIDKIIGKLYPIFGICLIVMALGIAGATLYYSGTRPMLEIWDHVENMYPGKELPIWPLMCITVACGAISGFHATQSPMMARCIKSEKEGRKVFYGAMVAEGVIALIWASAGIAFYYDRAGAGTGLQALLAAKGGNSTTVYDMSIQLLGGVGGVLAMLGVIACPITSGDTAFRSARLTIADWFKIDQKDTKKRLMLSVPLLLAGYGISFLDYNTIWRYFSWSNQTLAMMALWAAATYVCRFVGKNYGWIAAVPATYMTSVSVAYILQAQEGFRLPAALSNGVGICAAVVCLALYVVKVYVKSEVKSTRKDEALVIK